MNNELNSLIDVLSLVVGLINLNENLTQNDKQDLLTTLDNKGESLLNEIHSHLQQQDEKIDEILTILRRNQK